MKPAPLLTALSLLVATPALWAHGDTPHEKKAQAREISDEVHAFGREGDPKKARRTVTVDMADSMRFSPNEFTVKRGETVKFIVGNSGKTMHEMVIGTREALESHAEMMRKHPTMAHDEPYMAHVKPGAKEEITWTFSKTGKFMFGCLIPGHFEAGMRGVINVVAR